MDRYEKQSERKLLMQNRGEINERQLKKANKKELSRRRRRFVNRDIKEESDGKEMVLRGLRHIFTTK